MGLSAGLLYLGGALAYALAVTAVTAGLVRLMGRRIDWRWLVVLAATAFPVFLALHPFPTPGSLDCPEPWTSPQIRPFAFLDIYAGFLRQDRPLQDWLTDLRIVPPVMNVVLFLPAGAALACVTRSRGMALAMALGLTLFIETAQLTALFGLYPCPYRQFDVDDLILNVAGILAGFALARGMTGMAGTPR